MAEVTTPVHDERYGLPDMDVCTSRCEGRYLYGQARRVVEVPFVG
jgi:hypothetical protein